MMGIIYEDKYCGTDGTMEVTDLKAGVFAIRCRKSANVHRGSFTLTVFSKSEVTLAPAMGCYAFRKAETKLYDADDHYWKDPDFPAEIKSVGLPNPNDPNQPNLTGSVYCWLRPRDVAEVTDPCLFLDDTDNNDVLQGALCM
jgi:hypothetical protein